MTDTVEIRWQITTGLVGCTKHGVEEFEREDWENMSEDEREEFMKEIAFDEVDWGYEEVDF